MRRIRDDRWLHVLWFDVGPVGFIHRTLIDPAFQDVFLHGGERLACFLWRHQVIGINRENALDQGALRRLSRNHRLCSRLQFRRGTGMRIQAQAGLTLSLVESVAFKTGLREDRQHIPVVMHIGLTPGMENRHEMEHQNGNPNPVSA